MFVKFELRATVSPLPMDPLPAKDTIQGGVAAAEDVRAARLAEKAAEAKVAGPTASEVAVKAACHA